MTAPVPAVVPASRASGHEKSILRFCRIFCAGNSEAPERPNSRRSCSHAWRLRSRPAAPRASRARVSPGRSTVREGHRPTVGAGLRSGAAPASRSALGSSFAGQVTSPERAIAAGASRRQATHLGSSAGLTPHHHLAHLPVAFAADTTLPRSSGAPFPCRPARVRLTCRYEAALSRATLNCRFARGLRQARWRRHRKISVHKRRRTAQVIPGFSPVFSTAPAGGYVIPLDFHANTRHARAAR